MKKLVYSSVSNSKLSERDIQLLDTYDITKDELELFKQVEANLNTLRGEQAYLELMTSILSRGGSDEILYDIGADFDVDYDMKLKSEFDKIWNNVRRQ